MFKQFVEVIILEFLVKPQLSVVDTEAVIAELVKQTLPKSGLNKSRRRWSFDPFAERGLCRKPTPTVLESRP